MALPALLIPLALQAVGTGLSMYGQHKEAKSAQKISEYNAAVALEDAKLIDAAAALELRRGREQKGRFLSTQRARYAKAGVTSDGSPFEVLVQTAADIELDLQLDYFNSQIAARRTRTQATFDQLQAQQYRTQSWMRPLGTAITGVTQMAITSGVGAPRTSSYGRN